MEEVNLDNMEGENWSVKKHTVHKDKYVARYKPVG